MTDVFLLCGWFGDVEWIEGVYAEEEDARAECERLWQTRNGERGPEYARGLHKFSVDPWALQ